MAARLFCIVFALVGIPLNLVVLNRLGHLMQQGVHRCVQWLGGSWQVRRWPGTWMSLFQMEDCGGSGVPNQKGGVRKMR